MGIIYIKRHQNYFDAFFYVEFFAISIPNVLHNLQAVANNTNPFGLLAV